MPTLPVAAMLQEEQDIFGRLPYDIIHEICQHLPAASITSLTQASRTVHLVTHHAEVFWVILLKNTMPWFFEIHQLMDSGDVQGNQCKGIFLWAEKTIQPETDAKGPLLNLINRRRIWEACKTLAGRYDDNLPT
ncbi:hypothetical protein GGR54DRAFT_634600 [Hypoxylon sp. NC1633]|nr:hypothetical protein GGR54DRAFT_634600 [Hypoxylon sp. NC1633]